MTTQQQKRSPIVEEASEEAIAHYLQTHPEFFDRHDRLLESLHLPHHSGNAVSLIERQVTILRTRAAKLEHKLRELLQEGRANDSRATKTYRLATALIAARDRDSALQSIESSLRDDFVIEHAVLLLFVADGAQLPAGGFVRSIAAQDPRLTAIASLLEAVGPRCGRPTDAQRALLFGEISIGSTALVPIGRGERRLGLLALGSTDPNRFLPTMSVDFLTRIGELVGQALAVHES
jgi:uncharacterized protein YigA (DUF484 family)